jgi:DNA-binding MarR family transcriptional regulator
MASRMPDDEDLTGRLRLSVSRLARVFRNDETVLAPTDGAMLAAIAWAVEPTLGSLAATEHVAPPTVTKSVNKLEELGYVERVTDPDDGRVTRVRLSRSGQREVAAYRARVNAWIEAQLDELPARERNRLAGAVELLEYLVRAKQQENER